MRRQLRTHLQLRMLRAIAEIEEQQSLLKASGALGITQPALTRTLRDVETILGDKLFERHSRGVDLTPFGSIACEAARRILMEIDRLDEDLERFQSGETAVVAIGALAPAAVGVLPGFFAYLQCKAPSLRIRVHQGTMEELTPMLVSSEIAFLLGRLYHPETADQFDREVLYQERVSILARSQHPIFSGGEVTPQALSQYGFVLPSMSERVEEEFESLLSSLGLRLELRSSSLPFLRELLHESDSLTISPPQSMGGDIARGSIRVVPFEIASKPRPAGVTLKRDRQKSENEQRVVELLREFLLNSRPVAGEWADRALQNTHPL